MVRATQQTRLRLVTLLAHYEHVIALFRCGCRHSRPASATRITPHHSSLYTSNKRVSIFMRSWLLAVHTTLLPLGNEAAKRPSSRLCLYLPHLSLRPPHSHRKQENHIYTVKMPLRTSYSSSHSSSGSCTSNHWHTSFSSDNSLLASMQATPPSNKSGTKTTNRSQTLQTSELNRDSWADELKGKISLFDEPLGEFFKQLVPSSTAFVGKRPWSHHHKGG